MLSANFLLTDTKGKGKAKGRARAMTRARARKEGLGVTESALARLWRYTWKFRADALLLKHRLYPQGIQWDCIWARLLSSLDHIMILESGISA